MYGSCVHYDWCTRWDQFKLALLRYSTILWYPLRFDFCCTRWPLTFTHNSRILYSMLSINTLYMQSVRASAFEILWLCLQAFSFDLAWTLTSTKNIGVLYTLRITSIQPSSLWDTAFKRKAYICTQKHIHLHIPWLHVKLPFSSKPKTQKQWLKSSQNELSYIVKVWMHLWVARNNWLRVATTYM